MYGDRTLLPKEAMRLAVLGTLALGPLPYAALAAELRRFTSRIVGPSLELMGSSIEILRLEGLIAPERGGHEGAASEAPSDVRFVLTDAGRDELIELLGSAVRGPFDGINRLVLALKIRFLHLLDREAQRSQAEMMIEAFETELARLDDLRRHHAGEPGALDGWLAHETAAARARLDWFRDLRARL